MFDLAMKGLMFVLKGMIGSVGKSIVKIVMSMASEKFMTWAILDLGERFVKSTKTTADDEWFSRIKDGLVEKNTEL